MIQPDDARAMAPQTTIRERAPAGGSRKPRPRRIAADEAHAWARHLRLHNPHAKLILSMLTQYVNADGACFVSVPALAEDCELAPETVRRRLGWLEEVGAITRFPQWVDENGRRNGDGRGRRTTDEIRLMIAADLDGIEARACGQMHQQAAAESAEFAETAAGAHPQDAPADPLHGRGSNPDAQPPGTLLGLYLPSHCGGGLTSEPEPEDSPQSPPSGGVDEEDWEEPDPCAAGPDGWREFKQAFEADGRPILKVRLARQVFAALSPDERALAKKAAKGLIAARAREKRPGAKPAAQNFLREPESWLGFARLAPPEPVALPEPVFVAEDSEDFCALAVLGTIRGHGPPAALAVPERGRGLMVPGGLSPAQMALADFHAGLLPDGTLDMAGWMIVADGSRQCGAWKEFARTEARPITVRTERREIAGKIYEDWPVKVVGLRVPCAFPPRRDGAISDGADGSTATGPPADAA